MAGDPSTLALEVRRRRRDLHLTQDALADLAGTSTRFVRELEAGKATIRLDKVLDVLAALGLQLAIEKQPRGQ